MLDYFYQIRYNTCTMVKIEKKAKQRPTMLIILDGFGLANAKNEGNAVTAETAHYVFGLMKTEFIAHQAHFQVFQEEWTEN